MPKFVSFKKRVSIALASMDPNLKPHDESYKAAAVMIGVSEFGINRKRIASELNYPMELVSKLCSSMKRNGIWKNGKVYANWSDRRDGAVSFWCDVCVVMGLMKRL